MTKRVKRYIEEFKAEAVKAIENNSGNISATARHLLRVGWAFSPAFSYFY